ncbi:MAG: sigma-70 family RNA polymerase sigma factor [Thermoanaerobaculia bacterium]
MKEFEERELAASSTSRDEVSQLLRRWSGGETGAADELFPLVYGQLRAIAAAQMKSERADHTLQPTALVHELFLRLDQGAPVPWEDRRHFFRLASQAMRRMLVDFARRRLADRRGAGAPHVTMDAAQEIAASTDPEGTLAIDCALEKLAALDPRQEQVVEMRIFAGLSHEEIASALEISLSTVEREWRSARAWLRREFQPPALGATT